MLKQSLWDSWRFFKSHFGVLALIVLPIVIPLEICDAVYFRLSTPSDTFLISQQIPSILLQLAVYPIYAVGVVFYMSSAIAGNSIDVKTAWKFGLQSWLPYSILNLVFAVAVGTGIFLLVIPGIMIAIRWAFAEYHLLLEGNEPLEAIRNSWVSTRDYIWDLFGGYVIISLILIGGSVLFSFLLDLVGLSSWILDVVWNALYSVFGVMYKVFAFRVYHLAKENQGAS